MLGLTITPIRCILRSLLNKKLSALTFFSKYIVYIDPPTLAYKKTTNTAKYAAVAAKALYKRDLVIVSTIKKTIMKPDMTASRYSIGCIYTSA
jgi:hypothetical protein